MLSIASTSSLFPGLLGQDGREAQHAARQDPVVDAPAGLHLDGADALPADHHREGRVQDRLRLRPQEGAAAAAAGAAAGGGMLAPATAYMDRDEQIAKVEKTFVDSLLPIEEHYSKKGVYPVEIHTVLPDDKMWKYPCAQVQYG